MRQRPGSQPSLHALALELLESRTLLSTALPGKVPAPVAKIPKGLVPTKIVVPKTYGGKLDSNLWAAVQPVIQKGAKRPNSPAHYTSNGYVQVNIRFNGATTTAMAALRKIGIHVQTYNKKTHTLQVWVKPSNLQAVTRLASVSAVELPNYAIVSTGAVDSEGDSLLTADLVRQQFANYGIDGSGIKVGVISNGADHRADVGDDLPSVTVNPLNAGSGDEGTAMLEIVHDLAPGAQLYFSGASTNLDMVDAINYLVGQGCDIIVDDLAFPGEPFFQDGTVAQTAQNAVNNGVFYVSAAGNFGTPAGFFGISHYQHEFINDGTGFNDFLDGTGIDVFKELLVVPGGDLSAVLQWSDPFGASGNDYDLYLFNSTFQVIASSTDIQSGNSDPIESFTWVNNTGSSQVVRLAIARFSGAPRELELLTFGNGNGAFEYAITADSIFGQQAAPGVFAVSAVRADSPDVTEYFASQGPSTIYINFDDQTVTVRQSLDATAVDGVSTRVGQLGFFSEPFYGTSAAAPHAAAIAALVLQANHSLTPDQLTQDLQDTAVDLPAHGLGYDEFSGAGRLNALDAVFKAFTPEAPDLAASSDSGSSNSDNITNNTAPTIQGSAPIGSFVSLYIDNILDQAVQLGVGDSTYSLIPTSILGDGPHSFTVRVASSNVVSPLNYSNPSTALVVQIDTQGPAAPTGEFLFETGHALRLTFEESVVLSSANLLVQDLTHGGNISTILGLVDAVGTFTFVVPNGVLADGNYHASLVAGDVHDLAGNAMTGNFDFDFYALGGDANRDRTVDLSDMILFSPNWQQSGKTFSQGDFNYDGNVDARDLTIIAHNYQVTLLAP
ncbi:MAG TPA: Ig-like domain-containing protein [Tepidisphaeraceae bacterium]|nr:Ig-like domain-containing protein [Tepidisphaeraceae bacterium]